MPKRPSRRRRLSETRQSGARNFVCRQNRRTTGWFPSWTAGQMVPWESRNEYHFLLCAEVTPSISSIEAQPLQLTFELGGKLVRYTPDYAVLRASDPVLVEVKPDGVAQTEAAQVFFEAAREAAHELEYAFEVVTDKDLRQGWLLGNAVELVRLASPHDRPDFRQSILCSLADGSSTLGEVAPGLDEKRSFLYAMIRRGELAVSHDTSLGLGSVISVYP